MIVVNPNDLDIQLSDALYAKKSGNALTQLFGKTSLTAPFLASAKHEIIVPVPGKAVPSEYTKQSDLTDQFNFADSFISQTFRDSPRLPITASHQNPVTQNKNLWSFGFYGDA